MRNVKIALSLILILLASACRQPQKLMQCNQLEHCQQLTGISKNTSPNLSPQNDSIAATGKTIIFSKEKKTQCGPKRIKAIQMATAFSKINEQWLPDTYILPPKTDQPQAGTSPELSLYIGIVLLTLLILATIPDVFIVTASIILLALFFVLVLSLLIYKGAKDPKKEDRLRKISKFLRVAGRVLLLASLLLLTIFLLASQLPTITILIGCSIFFLGIILLLVGSSFNPDAKPEEPKEEEKESRKDRTQKEPDVKTPANNGFSLRLGGILTMLIGILLVAALTSSEFFFFGGFLGSIVAFILVLAIIIGLICFIAGLILLIKSNDDLAHQNAMMYRAGYFFRLGLLFLFLWFCFAFLPVVFSAFFLSNTLFSIAMAFSTAALINSIIAFVFALILALLHKNTNT